MLLVSTLALAAGFVLDLLIGDPQGWPHLVRLFGALIQRLETLLYPLKNKRLGGILLVLSMLLLSGGVPALVLIGCYRLSPVAFFAAEALLCWQALAIKSLRVESGLVYEALKSGDLPGARKAVSRIVGRDTERLDAAGVTRAAVETVAENASDGVIAPLFYLILGGGALGCLYKAVNTMDSMIGYKTDRYLLFGRAAAKLDDGLNYIPSRLSALFFIVACGLLGFDAKNARRIWRRDRRKHASPNSAQTESVMAGALRVRLAGNAWYFGVLHEKPTIGDDLRPIEPADILRAQKLMYASAWGMLILGLLCRGVILYAQL